jgi:Phospholipase_D-nuclease N-terminal
MDCGFFLRQAHHERFLDEERKAVEMMDIGYNGLWGLLVLAGDIWAIINIFQSATSNEKKLIWIVAVLLLPLLGLILWYLLGPRNGRA